MKQTVVQRIAMKGVIVNDKGEVLILREAATYGEGTQRGRYHMPGGRIEVGEPFEDALRREIIEEAGIEVDIEYPIYVGEWRPVIKGVETQIVAMFLVCKPKTTDIVLSTEHDDYQWIDPEKHRDFDIMDPEDKVLERFLEWQKRLR